jgi:hypothetical protein
MMRDQWFHRVALFLALVLFVPTWNACQSTSGSVGVDWGKDVKHQPPPPSHEPQPTAGYHKKGPPAHAPAHGYRAKHRYRYYPDACVYYESARGAYFFLDDGNWRVSVSLPSSIRLGSSYVWLELDTDEPYRYYDEHREKYPPEKRKKKKKYKG